MVPLDSLSASIHATTHRDLAIRHRLHLCSYAYHASKTTAAILRTGDFFDFFDFFDLYPHDGSGYSFQDAERIEYFPRPAILSV